MTGYRRHALLVLLLALVLGAPCLRAQADTAVWLITCYPGHDIYELEGHTALRIDYGDGRDMAVNWGVFDFDAPGFVYRFVKGETDYMAAAAPTDWFVHQYARAGRRVEMQRLRLDSEQTHRLVSAVERNLLPENRVYRYNYVKDNCATRPLDLVRAAVSPDSVALGFTEWDTWSRPYTFRDVMRRYHRNYPWYQFGIDLALGSGIDYPLQPRELAFAPVLLAEQVRRARTSHGPLADAAVVVVDLPADGRIEPPTPWYATPLAVCWTVFVLIVAATVRDLRRGRVTRWVDAVYFGILGLAGLLLTFLIFISVHEAVSPNWLYLWLNPFCLIPTIFIWIKRLKIVVFSYQIANFAVVTLGLMFWWAIPQSANAAFLPLVLADMVRSANYIYLYKRSR